MKIKYEKIDNSYDFDMEVEVKDYLVVIAIIAIINYDSIIKFIGGLL